MRLCVMFVCAAAMAANLVYQAPASGWRAERGQARVDNAVTREGRPSLRLESSGGDALVRSSAVKLTPGRHYELRGWLKAENLMVRDLDRTPVATGLSLSMASMPFDVHSESLGGTRGWQRVALRFVATRSEDRIEVRVAQGAAFSGSAWVEGVSVDEAAAPQWAAGTVRTFGPAYRYGKGGWIYLHIEGAPYERGYQHGFLLASEIPGYIDRSAAEIGKDRRQGWEAGRLIANSVFLRGFDEEMLQEMKGIADGAAAAGAKYQGRAVDLLDIVAVNTITEIGLLEPALEILPTGLEGIHLSPPSYFDPRRDVGVTERCSAFAATGKATRDGKMVIGHTTWWSQTLAEQTNIMLDVQPKKGRRVLMQSYPGGIQSGTDYYQNDAGMVLTETTIRQSPFNPAGTPVAYRARKAIQYAESIDDMVRLLETRNNGLYTNEWIIGDGKTDEIAMFELGTKKTRLYRSGKNDWFGGTEGFYWGCNNAKDLEVRSEYYPDPQGRPAHLPYAPGARDVKWVEMYDQHKGKIDEQFGFLAYRTAPLVSASAFDAKVVTSEMARNQQVWAVFGRPNQREWLAGERSKQRFEGNTGIFNGGYRAFSAVADEGLKAAVAVAESARLAGPAKAEPRAQKARGEKVDAAKLWKGYLIASGDADAWVTAGSVGYFAVLSSEDPDRLLENYRNRLRAALKQWDQPLTSYRVDVRNRFAAETLQTKAVLLFDALRRQMGDEKFFALMTSFYKEHTTQKVTAAQFLAAAGVEQKDLFALWLEKTGFPGDTGEAKYLLSHLMGRVNDAMIVYGTHAEAGTNRFVAESLQSRFLDMYESAVPVRKDFEVTEAELRAKNVVFVGRPETNQALAEWAPRLGLSYEGTAFTVEGKTRASEYEALAAAYANPLNAEKMVVVLAGNSSTETARLRDYWPGDGTHQVLVSGVAEQGGGARGRRR